NVIEHAVVMTEGTEITPADILLDEEEAAAPENDDALPYEEAKRLVIERFQRRYVERLLDETDNNLSAAARKAGLTRAALHRIVRRLGVAGDDLAAPG
ncbi:MAG TPA: helix-turn-helix domain-containing protein, partial [Polyangiales bacterium]